MGLFDSWSEKKRVKEAAAQLWDLMKRGYNIEIPLLFDKNDLTVQAITELQRRHPKVELRMYQSKGTVLGLFRGEGLRGNRGVGDAVLNHFAAAGNVDTGYETMKPEDLLARHESFLLRQGFDPRQAEKDAQVERAAREAMSVGSTATAAALEPLVLTPSTDKPAAMADTLPTGTADVAK